jgi:hypothetical protein
MGAAASKGVSGGVKVGDDIIRGGIKAGDDNAPMVFKASSPEEMATLVNQVKQKYPNAFVITKGNKAILAMDDTFSTTARTNLQNIAKQYNATSFIDGGKITAKGVTWQRVGLVAGGVIVAVILIDPSSGAALGESLGQFGTGLVSPMIPSIVSSTIPLSISLSMAVAVMFMSRKM